MRIIIKGGVWKNSEDEILKAAVMKYGKNQWARISSLLTRKTAKACKARWYEWLDPSIKKTEWSKEEDEKLLQLAKLMPTQWRTIAPIVGRTPSQCLERYQRLLDEAETKTNELGLSGPEGPETSAPLADDVRRLRPGEIDPDPEAKPARPDPVDMDEDEKEMLSEARARLANTQGKKAKRKARERQLEEARRLAALQKKRELKAAGIELKQKKKKRGIDYNADIPFEKKPAPGFYDTNEERERVVSLRGLTNVQLSKLDGKRRAEIEEEERKKDAKRQKLRKEKEKDGDVNFVAAGTGKPNIAKAAEQAQIARRKKLVLPSPQVGEGELEEIVKIGLAGEEARALAEDDDNAATKGLIGSYTPATSSIAARTPRTPAQVDNVMLEARNLLAQSRIQTPLMGQENAAVHESGFGYEGITPKRQVQQTPNPLLTPLHGGATPGGVDRTPGATPRPGSTTPFATPLRDEFSINRDREMGIGELTPRDERLRAAAAKKQLRSAFDALPAPANNFELAPPEVTDRDEDESSTMNEEDASDLDRRRKEAKEAADKERSARRSQVVQRSLPRPVAINAADVAKSTERLSLDADLKSAHDAVSAELLRILRHDAARYPVPGAGRVSQDVEPVETEFTSTELEGAREAVEQQLAGMGIKASDALSEAVEVQLDGIYSEFDEKYAYSFSQKKLLSVDEDGTDGVRKARIEGLRFKYLEQRAAVTKEGHHVEKMNKKNKLLHGGYLVRSSTLAKRLLETFDELEESRVALDSFRRLQHQERLVGPLRLQSLQEDVEKLRARQWDLNNRHQELQSEKARLEANLRELRRKKGAASGAGEDAEMDEAAA